MNAKTLTALRGSITKWERIVAGTGTNEGSANCPLCQTFCLPIDDSAKKCQGCPVQEKTGEQHCDDTPYYDYVENETTENAQRELDFLCSLLPPETTEIFSGPPERPWKTNNPEIAAKLRAADEAYNLELARADRQFNDGYMYSAHTTRALAAHALAMAYHRAAIS